MTPAESALDRMKCPADGFWASGTCLDREGHIWHGDCWAKHLEAKLRGPVHGLIQTIIGMCADELPYTEIAVALERLDGIVYPVEGETA